MSDGTPCTGHWIFWTVQGFVGLAGKYIGWHGNNGSMGGFRGRCRCRLGRGHGGYFAGGCAYIAPAAAEEYAADQETQCDDRNFFHGFPSSISAYIASMAHFAGFRQENRTR